MYETLKMMKGILNGKEKDTNENKLIEQYKKELSPNILAYFYTSNFGIIYKTCELYSKLSYEDKASFCLQELDKCLQTYDAKCNTKFITYFITFYKNRLLSETGLLNTNKRKIIFKYDTLEDKEIANNDLELETTDLILDNYNLTESERKQCKLLDMGYTIKEISKILNITVRQTYYQNEKIKQKILVSFVN